MKARLDDKVEHLRSQTMNFSNDGFEVSLNIPDTGDVKEAFGSLIDTVVDQENEITGLNGTITKMEQEHTAAQKKLLIWTAQSLQDVRRDNEVLRTKLFDAHSKIKNLSYNIQGYVDDNDAHDVKLSHTTPEIGLLLADNNVRSRPSTPDGAAPLFPTEEGAPFNAEFDQIMAETSGKTHIRKFAKFKTDEEKEAAKSFYLSVKDNLLPFDANGRWRWAIKKIMTVNKLKHKNIGFTRTRLEKNQTFLGQMGRIQTSLYEIPRNLRSELESKTNSLHHKIDTTTDQIKLQVSTVAEKVDTMEQETDNKFTQVNGDIANIHVIIEEVKKQMEASAAGESEQTKLALKSLHGHMHETVTLELERLQESMTTLTEELRGMDPTSDKLMQEVQKMATLSATAMTHRGGSEPVSAKQHLDQLAEMFNIDMNFRDARGQAVAFDQTVSLINRFYTTLHGTIAALHEAYSKKFKAKSKHTEFDVVSPLQMEQLQTLMNKCTGVQGHLQHLHSVGVSMQRSFHEHDTRLESKVRALSRISEIRGGYGGDDGEEDSNASPSGAPVPSNIKKLLEDLQFRMSVFEHSIPELAADQQQDGFDDDDDDVRGASAGISTAHAATTTAATTTTTTMTKPAPITTTTAAAQSAEDGGSVDGEDSVGDLQSISTAGGSPRRSQVRFMKSGSTVGRKPSVLASQVILETKLKPMIDRIVQLNLQKRFDAEFGDGASVGSGASNLTPLEIVPHDQSLFSRRRTVESNSGIPIDDSADSTALATTLPTISTVPLGDTAVSGVSGGGNGDGPRITIPTASMLASPQYPTTAATTTAAQPARHVDAISQAIAQATAAANDAPHTAAAATAATPAVAPVSVPNAAATSPRSAPPSARASGTTPRLSVLSPRSPRAPAAAAAAVGNDQNAATPKSGKPAVKRGSTQSSFSLRRSLDRGRSGKGSGMFDPVFLMEDMTAVKKQTQEMLEKVEKIKEESMNRPQVEEMFHTMLRLQKQKEHQSEQMRAINDLDRSVREVVAELIRVKKGGSSDLQQMREDFQQALEQSIHNAVEQATDANNDAVASTKALCLVCGRNSNVKAGNISRPISPQFLPYLNSNSIAGPDVYRAGFKIPVRVNSPPPDLMKRPATAGAVLPGGGGAADGGGANGAIRVAADGGGKYQQRSPINVFYSNNDNFDAFDADPAVQDGELRVGFDQNSRVEGDDSITIPSVNGYRDIPGKANPPSIMTHVMSRSSNVDMAVTGGKVQDNPVLAGPKPVRYGQGSVDSEVTRPIFRKGFPAGKKSLRAEAAYAPERFDLPGTPAMLLQGSRPKTSGGIRASDMPQLGSLSGTRLLTASATQLPSVAK